jgi:hypothetical protein
MVQRKDPLKGLVAAKARWHQLPEKPTKDSPQPHEVINSLFESILTSQGDRYDAYRSLWEHYGADCSMFGGSVDSYRLNYGEDLEANEAANAVETLHASVFKNRVVPTLCSVDGDYETFSQTKTANRFVEGVWDDSNVHLDAIPKAGLEAIVCGTGLLEVAHEMVSEDEARIVVKAPTVQDFFVDPVEARDNDPATLFRVKPVDRWKLLEEFGVEREGLYGSVEERRRAILEATNDQGSKFSFAFNADPQAGEDMILVREAWRKNGKHAIVLNDCTLVYEDWKRDWPIADIRLMPVPGGFWGQSILGRMVPLQLYLNEITSKIRDAHRLLGQPKIVVSPGQKVSKLQIDDSMGAIIEVEGELREWNPVPITPDAYRERDGAPQRMRNLIGQSQFASSGSVPAQLREVSGKAIESWQDADSARNAMFHRYYEHAVMKLGRIILEHAQWLVDHGYRVTVMAPSGRNVDEIDFSDINIDIAKCRMRVFPVSQLSKSYTSKMDELDRLLSRSAINLSTYRRLSENPDIEAQNEFDTSDEEIVLKNLQWILENETPLEPLSMDNHETIIRLGTKFYNTIRVKGASPMALLAIETYITKAQAKLAPPQPAAPPPGAPPGMMPPGMPPGAPPGPPGAPPVGPDMMGAAPPPDMGAPPMAPPPGMPPGGMPPIQ